MTTKSKVLLGILGAAAAGVAIGLLTAPDKGVETRKRLRSTTSGWANSLSTLFSNAKGELERKGKQLQSRKSAVEDKVQSLKEPFS